MSRSNDDVHRPNLPIKGAGKRDEAHSRWPLPLSLVLSILLWLSLNDSVHEEETVSCEVVVRDLGAGISNAVAGQILVRLPESRTHYTQSEVLDGNGKLLTGKVRIDFAGPGRFVSDLQQRLKITAGVKIPEDGRDEFIYKFTKSDLRTDPSDLSPFLIKMVPEEIHIKFVASGQNSVTLHSDRVQIEYPEPMEDWQRRFYPDTMEFEPKVVLLTGPAKTLELLKNDRLVFKLDGRRAPGLLQAGGHKAGMRGNPVLGFDLVLMQRYSGLTMQPDIKVRIEVALAPERFPQGGDKDYFTIPVRADWNASPLDRKGFEVSESMRIQIYSYETELTALLKKDGEKWVQRMIRATVDLGEIEGDYQSNETFFKLLTPHFSCYDKKFKLEQGDFRIEKFGIVEVKRR